MMEGKVHGWAAGMLGQADLSGDVLREIVPTPRVKNGNVSGFTPTMASQLFFYALSHSCM